MKKKLKVIYLFFILIVISCFFIVISGIKKEFFEDFVINDAYNYNANSMEYQDNIWNIKGEDPYIVFDNVNKYICRIDINIKNNGNYVGMMLYYDTGGGFKQEEMIYVEGGSEGAYYVYLKEHILSLRLDFEDISDDDVISDIAIVLHSGDEYLKSKKIIFFVSLFFMLLLCSFEIFYDIFINKSDIKIASIKIIIISIFLSMSVKSLLIVSFSMKIIIWLINIIVVLTCMFLKDKYYENA